MKTYLLYGMVVLYIAAGCYHFINPKFYVMIMPPWLSPKTPLINISGVVEIILALLLIPSQTRVAASWLIIAMLVIFMLTVHIPMSIHFFKIQSRWFQFSLARLAFQFVLIYWSWYIIK